MVAQIKSLVGNPQQDEVRIPLDSVLLIDREVVCEPLNGQRYTHGQDNKVIEKATFLTEKLLTLAKPKIYILFNYIDCQKSPSFCSDQAKFASSFILDFFPNFSGCFLVGATSKILLYSKEKEEVRQQRSRYCLYTQKESFLSVNKQNNYYSTIFKFLKKPKKEIFYVSNVNDKEIIASNCSVSFLNGDLWLSQTLKRSLAVKARTQAS